MSVYLILLTFFRFFSVGPNRPWKEKCDLHVEQESESAERLTNIQCTGKESGIKLRHEGELNSPCHVALMDAKPK